MKNIYKKTVVTSLLWFCSSEKLKRNEDTLIILFNIFSFGFLSVASSSTDCQCRPSKQFVTACVDVDKLYYAVKIKY